jgi:hypothetical protein
MIDNTIISKGEGEFSFEKYTPTGRSLLREQNFSRIKNKRFLSIFKNSKNEILKNSIIKEKRG